MVGVDSFMLCERSLGSNPAQVANYVEADFKGIEVNKKNNIKGLPSQFISLSVFYFGLIGLFLT